ncbi:peptide-methionine (S)-S-oxide reductase MsrA [Planococcus sp. ISL-109]|uniref:peptide-methionine (S)-S-oxide reductase MsrA n=1 Tax=Planococcus sp. ISL-109 TaxID=2819166 RepID=UPI001BE4FBE2|nr:peptide-methionine (S)-S-oxide reductase MsrA [Planococcus sp. ISL-109]MBT2582115.1 peptide-methionine (S)-S-oxide reductase MsrA [Planococcus sp. ISL-109]
MKTEKATFAGGCFWCMVKPFDSLDGIEAVVSGYTGGDLPNPTYEQVCTNRTGHREAVEITFQPDIYPYEKLLDVYWSQIDPTDAGGQFFDRGDSYKTAIYVHTEEQRLAAEQSKQDLQQSGKFHQPIATEILEAKPFYPAETYHQDYYQKNPTHYTRYATGSGRKSFIQRHWGDET